MQASNAYIQLARRYLSILKSVDRVGEGRYDSKEHLLDMCEKVERFTDREKQARWIGFIQGVLTAHGIIDLEREIELCRQLFIGGT